MPTAARLMVDPKLPLAEMYRRADSRYQDNLKRKRELAAGTGEFENYKHQLEAEHNRRNVLGPDGNRTGRRSANDKLVRRMYDEASGQDASAPKRTFVKHVVPDETPAPDKDKE